jgi:hypothetical protein
MPLTHPSELQLGRLAVKAPEDRLPIKWVHEYFGEAAGLPPAGGSIDGTGGIADDAWLMLGNGPDDGAPGGVDVISPNVNGGQPGGNCGPVASAHSEMAKGAAGKLAALGFTADQWLELYLRYTGGQDVGVNIADWLLWLYQQKLIDAFAPVPLDLDKMCAAAGLFHGTLVGADLTPNDQQEFFQGIPFSGLLPPDPTLGHCLLLVTMVNSLAGPFGLGTWGKRHLATLRWLMQCVVQNLNGEAWVIVTAQDAAESNLELAALQADLDALGGTGTGPTPTPRPSPVPPAPVPPIPSPGPAPAPVTPPPATGLVHLLEAVMDGAVRAFEDIFEKAKAEMHAIIASSTAPDPGDPS